MAAAESGKYQKPLTDLTSVGKGVRGPARFASVPIRFLNGRDTRHILLVEVNIFFSTFFKIVGIKYS